jgi:hypothetical protein
LTDLPLSTVPVLHAEVQVAGLRAPCTRAHHSLLQSVDYQGRPSSTVKAGLIVLVFTGEIALDNLWVELGMDSFRRVGGHVGFFHEEGHTMRRLTFYEAACVFYQVRFDARGRDGPSLETEVHFSAAAVDFGVAHLENHTRLWWEKNAVTRFNALNKPTALLPSPSLRAQPIPATSLIPPPTVSSPIVLPPVATLPAPPTVPVQSSISTTPSTPSTPSQVSKNKRKKLLGPQPTKDKSKRLQYLGRTPGKNSSTGQDVQKRMVTEGKIRDNQGTGTQEVLGPDGNWYTIDKTDMGHLHDAVNWWNTVGRNHGAKSPEVRRWMLDSTKYELEPSSINRSRGAKLKETYLPPLK